MRLKTAGMAIVAAAVLALGSVPAAAATSEVAATSATENLSDIAAQSAISEAISNLSLDEDEFVLGAASIPVAGNPDLATAAKAGVATPAAAGVIVCTGKYDYPHASASSSFRAVNAHLAVSCSGPRAGETKISVESRMTATGGGNRMGTISKAKGKAKIRVGGDLKCTGAKYTYQAVGKSTITFPFGYFPMIQKGGVKSKAIAFKADHRGHCVK